MFKTTKHHESWLYKLQNNLNELKFQKLDKDEFYKKIDAIDIEQAVIKETSEMCENHFAMVENFVEKYIPIRI